jgi:hypothetical protein
MPPSRQLLRKEFRERVRAARAKRGWEWSAAEREPYEAHLRALVQGAEISKRVRLEAFARILDDGRFKTPYEPRCLPSGNPVRSAVRDAQVWNVSAEAFGELPTFGYLATTADVAVPETRAYMHNAYGSVRVMLAGEVKARCTVFFADSLWAISHDEGAPAPLDAPDELCWLPDRCLPPERLTIDEGGPDEVAEIQIIGGLSVDEISSVRFDFKPPESIVDALSARAIKWCVNSVPTLPSYSRLVPDTLSASLGSDAQPDSPAR